MSIAGDLLVVLSSYSKGYRLARARMGGYTGPVFEGKLKKTRRDTIRTTLYRLQKQGLVKNNRGVWRITAMGRKYVGDKMNFHRSRIKKKTKPKELIISFDIPEKHKRKRNWLRAELINLGFEMLHRSVWFGPAPLPRDFVEVLADLDLLKHMKFFEAKESGVI